MNITVSNEALQWYKEELEINRGDMVKFFVRYGGCSTVQRGFSLGVAKQQPVLIGAQSEIEGITFYIEDQDLWYFEDNDLVVTFDATKGEPEFSVTK
ncbi:HesB/YadR/YfhF family protein [Priestia abyssalis]|uniref:HesB/YadR/YfhF family protein n=1 Tax=Priestia abyssalis TaxID=1221450 RepID=UPI000994A315|nr:HesB/YadR/YfhF family protein [Priestia abyssalis]